MRRITRNALVALGVVVVVLLALGALPGYLKSGDPYYVVATVVDSPPAVADDGTVGDDGSTAVDDGATASSGNGTGNGTVQPFNATDLPGNRYPYTTAALASATPDAPGRSHPYWRGPVGLKGAFTHSPFDELEAIAGREPNATDGDAVYVRQAETTFRLAIQREGEQ